MLSRSFPSSDGIGFRCIGHGRDAILVEIHQCADDQQTQQDESSSLNQRRNGDTPLKRESRSRQRPGATMHAALFGSNSARLFTKMLIDEPKVPFGVNSPREGTLRNKCETQKHIEPLQTIVDGLPNE